MYLLQCRAGFEADCAAEVSAWAAAHGAPGYCRATPGAGWLEFESDADPALDWAQLVFARQVWPVHARHAELPPLDRLTPIVDSLPTGIGALSGLVLEHPDTNDGKSVSVFLRKFERPLTSALRARGIALDASGAPRLHIFFTDSSRAWLGLADPARAAPWPMGILRLRFPRGAPSRSTLKLDEAFRSLLSTEEQVLWLRPGMRAVDLGAAPGGWTWQLVQRHIRVVAVDNGPMDAALLESGLVEHRREDGFRYRPAKPVDWLVCDMVEQPQRVVALVGDWLTEGACRSAVFNLKLPMKKRHAMVEQCLTGLRQRCGAGLVLRCKQLYHDREEVTVLARMA